MKFKLHLLGFVVFQRLIEKYLKVLILKKLIQASFVHAFELLDHEVATLAAGTTVYLDIVREASYVPGEGHLNVGDEEAVKAALRKLNKDNSKLFKKLSKFQESTESLSAMLRVVDIKFKEAHKFSELPDLADTITLVRNVAVHLVELSDIDEKALPRTLADPIDAIRSELLLTKPKIGDAAGSLPAPVS